MDVSQEDLSKLSINNSSEDIELDHSYQEDFYSSADEDHADEDDVSDKIPESMLKYFEASENRASQFEKLILEDNEDDDSRAAEVYSIISSCSEDLLMELASDLGLHEDPVKLKEQVMLEMEDEKLNTIPNKACPHTVSDSDITDRVPHNSEDDIECDAYLRSEKQLSLELKTLERKLKEEDERRIVEYEVERKKEQNEQREKEEGRKRRQRDFEEELRQIEEDNKHRPTGMEEMSEREAEEKLQQEFFKQQELISSLQRQMEEERRAFEKVQEEKRRKTHQSRCRAAITIQAALRGVLARRWTRAELHRRREEQRRSEEERNRREERWRREQEEQRLKQEKENRRRELEEQALKRRSLEYERAKEEDRVRMERERQDEEDRRKREDQENRKEGERRKGEEKRKKHEEEEKRKKEEEKRRKEEEKRKKEERREKEEQIREEKDKQEREEERRKRLDEDEKENERKSKEEEEIRMESDERKPKSLQKLGTGIVKEESQNPSEEKAREEKSSATECSPTASSPPIDPSTSAPQSAFERMSVSLPEQTEQRRLAWMRDCTSWSKLSLQNKRKQQQGVRTQRRRGARRAAEGSGLPLLCPETLLQSGAWNSPQEVTTVVLEDLPGCSLSTLSQCPRLQTLTMRRCGLKSLEGLSQCTELRYIDVQDNLITFVDCENLANLQVLRLGRNRLTSIHGLAGAVDLDVLELSHNSITRIGGLEPLKRLQKLLLDHNQLISTRGLREVYTLLHLDLSHNHLSSVEGLDNCALLNTLDLTGNNLTELPSLRNQVLLVELHLEDNSISSLEGLTACWLPLMQLLSGAQNSITQLPSLCHFVSLEKLDIRDNCLLELQNLCESLQGCPLLREVHLTGNPLQQESMWRSSLQRAVPGLQAIDGQPVGSSPALPGPGLVTALLPQNSFLAFCQAQLQQLHTLQHSHTAQLSSALPPLDALRLSLQLHDEAVQLAEEHRYAHEYGDTSITDKQDDSHRSDTARVSRIPAEKFDVEGMDRHGGVMNRKQPENKSCGSGNTNTWPHVVPLISPANDNSEKQPHPPAYRSFSSLGTVSTRPELKPATPASYTSSSSTFSEEKTSHATAKPSSSPFPKAHIKLDLKNMAAVVIQCHWRGHRGRQRIQLRPPPGEEQGGRRGRERGRVDTGPSHTGSEQSRLEPDYAATAIQAVWRGFTLRRRLAAALAQARGFNPGDHEAFEEVNVDEFVFDEMALERDWMMTSLLSDDSPPKTLLHPPPFPDQLLGPKRPLNLPNANQQTSPPVLLWKPKQAWMGGERAEPAEHRVSLDSISRTKSPVSASGLSGLSERSPASVSGLSGLSERSPKILEEWGFRDSHTALMMLKRAQKMKSKKQRQRKLLDPTVRLALFRNHSNQHAPMEAPKKPSPERRDYIKAHQAELALEGTGRLDQTRLNQQGPGRVDKMLLNQDATERVDQTLVNQERTYQWLHTQPVHSDSRRPESDGFLPEIDPDILKGGRVQLVAVAGYREGPDQAPMSRASGTSTSPPHKEHNEARRNFMGQLNKEAPSPQRVTSASSKKERMSFRDNPVQMSGGWGGGKKRDKLHK
ncbi:leucine-rich repeat- and IQ domain-containing protein 1 [Oncorhynchus clarkii lewisi]|uniref:leucine-rich repeat- and IQ domain-containing protein 1 n=1 Tax=Oncorhynchus clarkii lewisi TaxID=490388 RepID=UPI0039B94F45